MPEILRSSLTNVVLLLLSLGINDLIGFEFMDPPSKESIMRSLEVLYALGALNSKGKLTKTGYKMSEFPLDPVLTKCILLSEKYGVTKSIIGMIAMINESGNLFYRPKDKKELAEKRKEEFVNELGDQLMLMKIWRDWCDVGYSKSWCDDYFIQYKTMRRVKNVYDQLIKLVKKIGIEISKDGESSVNNRMIQKAIVGGFFMNIVKLNNMGDGYSKLKGGKNDVGCFIHPSSSLYKVKPKPKMILYNELVLTSKEYMRNCMIVDENLVKEMASHYYNPIDNKKQNQ
ncbi:uncharacterized protein J8A68_000032 [[Candida] subhashii]|uniref:Helicase-associated domain-containing protein n=1 Tax=[Candida] subhashii TaxID=561895 RepID=A0A8J5QKK6_9ASCO|nr:uncharacterized protein J8A68_000032 [[Candida] subhashii]KAG7666441.1 hypothetical protein J8A68_000032 [[Candida] subhashii]